MSSRKQPKDTGGMLSLLPPIVRSKPEGMTWRDYLVLLVHVGAEIEHALMVEYLYAAYSLDSSDRPDDERRMIERWRGQMLLVAREEMGHLATVQNLLTFLGAPICLDRQDYPWDHPYTPFPFALEPMTHASLGRYVYVEMPDPNDPCVEAMFPPDEFDDVRKQLRRLRAEIHKAYPGVEINQVGKLYEAILEIIKDPTLIPESAFRPDTYSHQASWDDWGRNYAMGARKVDAEGSIESLRAAPRSAPQVLVLRMATRTDAISALERVAGQGEEPQLKRSDVIQDKLLGVTHEPSHFLRFFRIWQEYGQKLKSTKGKWRASRDIPLNPTTIAPDLQNPPAGYIRNANSRRWADFFNLRYRMLLTYLAHSFRLSRTTSPTDPSVRAATMHRVFAEMYNLKAIAGILVHLPFDEPKGRARKSRPAFAGAPFEQPYSLDLPDRPEDVWRMHRDLLTASRDLTSSLLESGEDVGHRYLKVLRDIDRQSEAWLDSIIEGMSA